MKLINLDRSVQDSVARMSEYKGEMYKMESGWTTSQCDWKQLDLLAAEIILGTHEHITIVKHSPRVDQDERALEKSN